VSTPTPDFADEPDFFQALADALLRRGTGDELDTDKQFLEAVFDALQEELAVSAVLEEVTDTLLTPDERAAKALAAQAQDDMLTSDCEVITAAAARRGIPQLPSSKLRAALNPEDDDYAEVMAAFDRLEAHGRFEDDGAP
jgi:hypothetical protein